MYLLANVLDKPSFVYILSTACSTATPNRNYLFVLHQKRRYAKARQACNYNLGHNILRLFDAFTDAD